MRPPWDLVSVDSDRSAGDSSPVTTQRGGRFSGTPETGRSAEDTLQLVQDLSGYGVADLGGTAGTGSSGSRSAPKALSGTTGASGRTAAILR